METQRSKPLPARSFDCLSLNGTRPFHAGAFLRLGLIARLLACCPGLMSTGFSSGSWRRPRTARTSPHSAAIGFGGGFVSGPTATVATSAAASVLRIVPTSSICRPLPVPWLDVTQIPGARVLLSRYRSARGDADARYSPGLGSARRRAVRYLGGGGGGRHVGAPGTEFCSLSIEGSREAVASLPPFSLPFVGSCVRIGRMSASMLICWGRIGGAGLSIAHCANGVLAMWSPLARLVPLSQTATRSILTTLQNANMRNKLPCPTQGQFSGASGVGCRTLPDVELPSWMFFVALGNATA